MPTLKTDHLLKACSINALVIRADGYREDLGRVSYWDRNLFKRFEWKVKQYVKKLNDSGLYVASPVITLAHPHVIPGIISTLPLLFPLATLQVNEGRAILTGRFIGATPAQIIPDFIGWGTGTGTTSGTDTTLFFETFSTFNNSGNNARPSTAFTQVTTTTTNDTLQNVQTLTAAQNQNGTQGTLTGPISNAGLFDASGQVTGVTTAPTGGNLYMKGDFAIINLSSGDAIQFTIKIQYS